MRTFESSSKTILPTADLKVNTPPATSITSPPGEELKPTVANPPTNKSAPKRYEDALDIIRQALTDPARQVEALQQLQSFFETRIAGIRNTRQRDGAGAIKSSMESKWSKAGTPTSLVANK